MVLMLYVKSKQSMERFSFITQNLIITEVLTPIYHSVRTMLFLDLILEVQILSVHIIYSIPHVMIANYLLMLILIHHHKINLVGLVDVETFFVLVLTIILFVMLMVLSFRKKEFFQLITVGLVTILKIVKKFNQSMGIIVKTKIMVCQNMKVSLQIIIQELCGLS